MDKDTYDNILIDACRHNDIATVLDALTHGANPNAELPTGEKALHFAVAVSNLPLVAVLLRAGADPNLHGCRSKTALHYAAQAGDEQMLMLLLAAKADLHATTNDGHTAADLTRAPSNAADLLTEAVKWPTAAPSAIDRLVRQSKDDSYRKRE